MPDTENAQNAAIILSDPASSAEARVEAALVLFERPRDFSAQSALRRAISSDDPPGSRRAAALAVPRARQLAPEIVAPLTEALRQALAAPDVATIAALLGALGATASREAARTIVMLVPASPAARSPIIMDAAAAALGALSGRADLGRDPGAWRRWLADAERLTDREWDLSVIAGHRHAAEAAAISARSGAERLAGAYRRLFALSPEESRSAILSEMLNAPEADLKLAAFDLVMVALLNAKVIADEVSAAAATCLADPDPRVRASAAKVAELVTRPENDRALSAALADETDIQAAAAMLRASARRPGAALPRQALRWLTGGPVVQPAALEALLASAQSGVLDGPSRKRVRDWLATSETPGAPLHLRLAIALGDVARAAAFLESSDVQVAQSAGEAFAEYDQGVAPLVIAARTRPWLFDAAARALIRARAAADGYNELAALPAQSAEQRDAAMTTMLQALPPGELSLLAHAEPSAEKRELLLSAAAAPAYFAQTADLAERIELALLLARTRLALAKFPEALEALDLLPSDWQGPRAASLRLTLLLCMGKVGEADTLASAAPEGALTPASITDAWLDALTNVKDASLVRELHPAFETRFLPSATETQAARFRALPPPQPALTAPGE